MALVAVLAAAGAARGGAAAQEDTASPAANAGQTATARPATYNELARELEARRRELEDILIDIDDEEATPQQRARIRVLEADIRELRTEVDGLQGSEAVAPEDDSFDARWIRFREAFRDITSWDLREGMLRFQIGVRTQLDATLASEDTAIKQTVGTIENGVKLRRGRVFAKGRLLRAMDFWLEYDFGTDVGIKNAYVEGRQISEWVADRFRWRVGLFQEPFGIARTTSSPYDAFMEIGLPADALAPGHNTGLMLRHAEINERMTWAAALTTNSQTTDDNPNNSQLTLTGRVTLIPVLSDDGRNLLHVGVSVSDRQPTGDSIRYRARPEARFAPYYADTGEIPSGDVKLLGLEVAMIRGSNWLQAEWIESHVDVAAADNPRFTGAYVELGRFLTGEQRPYDRAHGSFGRVTPNSVYGGGNPRRVEARGAFEVTARYSTVDLSDREIAGGRMRDVSLGLNWYMNDVSRVTLNYVHSELRGVGDSNALLLRFQYNP